MKRTVLVVEDEPAIAELERDYLEMNGFQTEIAVDGEQGLHLSLSGKFDMIILDVMLPKLNGFEVCKKIRAELDIPILMVTARREDIDIVRGLGLGADDYITKPFKPSELVARVKAHLSRYDRLKGSGASSAELEIRDLRLDPDSRRAFIRDEEIVLTTKEFDLLHFLVLHPNHVFSKDQLFERLWGASALGDTQTVTVHIRKLREKIEEDSANPVYIETLWGAGYRFRS